MNSFKKLIVLALCFLFLTKASLADSHDVNKELVEKAKEITKNLENNEVEEEEDVPLNDPFAGNEGSTSTINPDTGEDKIKGEYLLESQGEDVVSGFITPQDINQKGDAAFVNIFPDIYKQINHRLFIR